MAEPLTQQLRQFLVETNAIALAIGVVVGGAVSKLVAVLVTIDFLILTAIVFWMATKLFRVEVKKG